VNSEVSSCTKFQIFWGPCRWSSQRSPRPSSWWGEARFPSQEPHPALGHSGIGLHTPSCGSYDRLRKYGHLHFPRWRRPPSFKITAATILDLFEKNIAPLARRLWKPPRTKHEVDRTTAYRNIAIWNFSKMAAAAILDLFEPKIAPLDPPSPKTPS